MKFFNSIQKNMSFSDVVASIKYFIKTNPDNKFKIAVGTDSRKKGKYTSYATGIHIHRIGQGAWCCVSKWIDNKRYGSIKEKIARETLITYELVNMLNEQLGEALCGFAEKYRNFECKVEAHIGVGMAGETRTLIREMAGYFEGVGIDAKIKPESFVASCYATRYNKKDKVS